MKQNKKRHKLEVTSDRLSDHYIEFYADLSLDALIAINLLMAEFRSIVEKRNK